MRFGRGFILVAFACVVAFAGWTLGTRSPGVHRPTGHVHHHAHSHDGHTHSHAHGHAHGPARVGAIGAAVGSARSVLCGPAGGEDEDHHCCGCHGGSGTPIPIVSARTRHVQPQLAGMVAAIPAPSWADALPRRAAAWWPPPRAGPPDHLRHLRTVVLLT